MSGGEDADAVAGLVLVARQGDAGAGETWRARRRDAADAEVVVRRLALPPDEMVREHVRRGALALLTLAHGHLVPVREVLPDRDGVALVIDVPAGSLALSRLLAVKSLEPAQVVSLGVELARALAAAHAAGLTHGRLSIADVLLAPDGRALLAGVGVGRLLGSAGAPEDDVRALAALLEASGAGSVPYAEEVLGLVSATAPADAQQPGQPEVEAVLAQALADDGVPPTAAAFAAALAEAWPARPVRPGAGRPGATPRPAPPGPAVPRRLLVAGVMAAALVMAALVGWRTGLPAPAAAPVPAAPIVPAASAGPPPGADALTPAADLPPPIAPPTSARPTGAAPPGPAVPVDWRQVLADLDAARSALFAEPVEAGVREVDAEGSSAWAYDLAAVRALHAQQAHAEGLRAVVDEVVAVEAGHHRVVLDVVDRYEAYRVVNQDGVVLEEVPARPPSPHRIILVRTDAGWRIAQVLER